MQLEDMQTREDFEQALLERAAGDQEFRSLLVGNPREAIQQASGLSIPEGVEISVHEERSDSFHLVVPMSDRITDVDLAAIMGGQSTVIGEYPQGESSG